MARLKYIWIIPLFLLGSAGLARAFVASSSNYILQSDSINFGGGFSTSAGYRLQDTAGEAGTGTSTDPAAIMSSGYQAMALDTYIAISSPGSVSMTPAINGLAGGVSNGSSTWTVQTDNPGGYELSARAAGTPALASGANSFSDYVPSYTEADYSWNTPATQSRFGYTAEGADIAPAFRDNGISCGSGLLDTPDKCWIGLSILPRVVARATTSVFPAVSTTTLLFRAEVGAQKTQAEASYSATVIMTAVTL